MENALSDSIILKYKTGEGVIAKNIAPQSTVLIYVNSYVFGTVGVDDARYNDEISNISVKKDTVEKNVDESHWKYEELDKYHAKYMMKIDTTIIQ